MKNSIDKMRFAAAIILLVTAAASCTHQPFVAATPIVSFRTDIIPVLTTRCALNSACHSGTTNSGHNIDLDSAAAYVSIQNKHLIITDNPSASLLYVEVSSGIMPKAPASPLTAAQTELILNWIKQGAKNN